MNKEKMTELRLFNEADEKAKKISKVLSSLKKKIR